ncbi:poly(R)-hydroxyalkanoic acid synthase subunit PhaE [Methylobacterium sp. WSM2598]|uniref:poly(R)-hydroxyalkanoic acid synthase subunit PhaE n=1 Tax=Methylobacterium sp. WSM2598 TaxID=398261 RepID=UPI000369266D|nr:poly(R)-hydroxyalkanoic acid synthase subunit PhaE [Methylobacterium sp. WSM2598]
MDPFDTFKAMGELWGKGTQSFLEAQRNMFGAMTTALDKDGKPSLPLVPDWEALQQAQHSYQQAWEAAQAVSATFAKSVKGRGEVRDPIAADVLAKIFDPRGWLSSTSEVDEALNRMAEGPRLADLWNVERKFAAVFTAWVALRRRNLEHNTLMMEVWKKATAAFSAVVNERSKNEQGIASSRELMALWVETANDVLLEAQRSEEFLKSQRETLKASTDLRLAQQDIAEFYSQMFGYPTRAELDDVHQSLTQLRREVRALNRQRRTSRKSEGEPT